jgi:hypothetical protein
MAMCIYLDATPNEAARSRGNKMKIAVLSHKEVSGYYAATLMARGHHVTMSGGGAIHAPGLKPYLECDGCLLLGDEPRVWARGFR